MQKEQFYKALEAPKEHLPALRDELLSLSNAYPWFALSHVLLSKADHLAGHVAFDANLKRAAIYTGEREALFDLIHKEDFSAKIRAFEEEIQRMEEEVDEEQVAEPEIEQEETAAVSKEQIQPIEEVEVLEHAETSAEAEAVEAEVAVPEVEPELKKAEESVVHEEERKEQGVQPAAEEEGEEKIAERKKLKDFEGLQQEILLEAISSSIEQEVQVEERKITLESAQKEEVETPASAPTEVEEEKKQLSSFAQFLQKRSKEIAWETSQKEAETTETTTPNPTEIKESISREALVDRFIAADPKITPKKSAMFSNENLAKMSLVEDEQFVTETMAKIYAKQGASNKAIKAYKLLSLKYPEKSIYFANQIKKLQERRKSTK